MLYYEVYIDQLFLENLVILVLLQKTGAKLMHLSVSWKRVWLTSLLGAAVMCAVIFFRPFYGRCSGILRLLPVVLASAAGFGCRTMKETCRGTLYLLAAAAFYGGAFQMIFSIWEPPVLLAALLADMAVELLIDGRRKRMVLEECRAEVTLSDQGGRWVLTGLLDTGNHLTEPISGRPVSILDWQEAEKMQRFRQIQEEKNGYLYIPYHTIGTEKGWMKGMVIDEMVIRYQGKEIRTLHPVLAVSSQQLSPQSRYQMIVHPLHFHRDS
ncbi:MAG: sigma-E processing peptidase SpoIIGA [Lachnospiraceae bacterium]|nr:sigma-E processing peptidase SpoIIGA [Lachnospiraceae bacterium]